jgi:HK97 family phage major capsid protein
VPYNNIISRSDVDAFIPEDVATEVLQAAIQQSAALSLFPTITMSSKTRRMPVLSALPVAYFVNGDTGLKQTTEMAWGGKYLEAEEIACIVPVPENVIDDADFDLWGQVQPRLAEAVGQALDAAIFSGTNKPATWPAAVIPAAIAAGNIYERGTNAAAAGGIAADVSSLFSVVEADGFEVGGFVAKGIYKGLLRNARDANGVLLSEVNQGSIYGVPIRHTNLAPGGWGGAPNNEGIAGDFTQGILGIRQDLTYKLLDQAVITDAAGLVIFNLPQQDMVALRVTARYGWQVANTMTYENSNDTTRYPFAVMQNATP